MIAHLQRAATTAALIPALYGPDDPRYHLRPWLIAAEYRSADAQLPLLGDPQEALSGGVLDYPAARLGARAPEQPVWMCSVRSDPRRPDLTDTQWSDVARRLVTATGLAPDDDPLGSRWVAIRNLARSVHIVATVVREDGQVHRSYRDAFHVQAECHRIATELGHLPQSVRSVTTAKEYRMPAPVITISIEPSGSVAAKGASDDLSATLLRHAGFRQIEDWHGRRHRLPTTTAPTDRASIATHAAEMLRAARYNVDLDPALDTAQVTTPTDPLGRKVAGRQVLELTDRIRGAATAAEAAAALDQLLDPDDGVLARVQEALEAASEQITDLDPEQFALSDRFGFAADFVCAAQSELVGVLDEVQRARTHQAPADTTLAAGNLTTATTSAALATSPAVLRASAALGKTPPATAAPALPVPAPSTGLRTR
ncbi:hypothetical protein OG455_38165 [Kitasatospora sp. NBC_01287]|uniref:hypothetical protein n=1 Tax=Kitasatospora sp. NBC_01287 TaxID=2903573 RepID=UPI00224E9294|nr:hypothetical protein [Kitasatospora sp. NBC_01287]MCX4751263.1 hypothetical protein [Kitasatospora sp. NBC_01287]